MESILQMHVRGSGRKTTDTFNSNKMERVRTIPAFRWCLLHVQKDTLESNAWAEKKPCHLVLPDDRPKIWKNEDNASVRQVSASDENNEIHGYRNNLPMV